jgi:2'-5' RNA ligase
MRVFIAVELTEVIRENVNGYIGLIMGSFGDLVKWVSPGNLHFTLKFLGEIDKPQLEKVKNCVSMIASEFPPFSAQLSGVGFFPSQSRPRVIWLGADDGADRFLEVFQSLESCLEIDGFDRDDKPFSPHLTIGRVKKNRRLIVPKGMTEFEPVEVKVDKIAVVMSTLTPEGPVYEKLFESELASIVD